jgi:hypothetical protein
MNGKRNKGAHLDDWVLTGRAILVPASVSAAFADYIEQLPWMASSLDWERMSPSSPVDLSDADKDEVFEWFTRTSLAKYSHVVAWYGPNEEGLAVEARDGIQHLDTLFWGAPGTRFAFGASFMGNTCIPSFADFLEYRGADIVTATLAPAENHAR